MTGVLLRMQPCDHRATGRTPWKREGRSNASPSPGKPKTAGKPQEAGKRQGRIQVSEGGGPVDTSLQTSSFRNHQTINNSVVLSHPVCGVLLGKQYRSLQNGGRENSSESEKGKKRNSENVTPLFLCCILRAGSFLVGPFWCG